MRMELCAQVKGACACSRSSTHTSGRHLCLCMKLHSRHQRPLEQRLLSCACPPLVCTLVISPMAQFWTGRSPGFEDPWLRTCKLLSTWIRNWLYGSNVRRQGAALSQNKFLSHSVGYWHGQHPSKFSKFFKFHHVLACYRHCRKKAMFSIVAKKSGGVCWCLLWLHPYTFQWNVLIRKVAIRLLLITCYLHP